MKKFLTCLMIGIIVSGCDPEVTKINEVGKSVVVKEDEIGMYSYGRLFRVEWEGHVYIVRNDAHKGGICHDPDCPNPKCNSKKE